MRIVSKYKDFYDYIVQDHDANITYVRNIGLVNEYFDDLFRVDGNSIPYYSKYYGYQDTYIGRRKNGELMFDNFIFGIYPYVYSQPILNIYYNNDVSTNSVMIILNKEIVDGLINNDKNSYNKLIKLAQNEYDKVSIYKNKVGFLKYAKVSDIKHYVWKVDCPDIFYKIESPIFIKYNYDLFVNGAYWDNWPEEQRIGKLKDTHYVTDISFQKLNYNILKYWYNELNDLNTYINIENFLWSIKQEPEAKPDNKTKILAHGFDLKTSFRKM